MFIWTRVCGSEAHVGRCLDLELQLRDLTGERHLLFQLHRCRGNRRFSRCFMTSQRHGMQGPVGCHSIVLYFHRRREISFLNRGRKPRRCIVKESKICKMMIQNLTLQMYAAKCWACFHNLNRDFQAPVGDWQCERVRIMRCQGGGVGGRGSDGRWQVDTPGNWSKNPPLPGGTWGAFQKRVEREP